MGWGGEVSVPGASERLHPNSAILRPAGRIDLANAEPFKDALLAAVAAARTAVILDFSGIEYVSSAGLRSLMVASKTARPRGVALGVAALQPVVKEIFSISRFDLVVPCFETVRDAVAKLDPGALASFDAR
jgi:anti-sigma B factor antagonist/stage II sporulation protein AA (anti-sigma F factor antagonist)